MAIAMLRSRSTVKVMRIRANVRASWRMPRWRRRGRRSTHFRRGENAATMDAMPDRTRPARNIAMADAVAKRSGTEQQAGHDQRIGVDDP